MDRCILIDNEQLCFIKATETVRQAEYWADILLPKRDFIITGESNRDYSCYSNYELRMLYYNTVGTNVPDNIEYAKMLKGVADLARALILDETSVEDLKKKLGHEVPPVDPRPATEKPRKSSSGTSKPAGRPKEGSTTAKVWLIADQMNANDPGLGYDSKEFRTCVINECTKDGINPSTAATQFGKWKKHLIGS